MCFGIPNYRKDDFLEACYSKSLGWRKKRHVLIEGVSFDYVFQHLELQIVMALKVSKPYVSASLLDRVERALKAYRFTSFEDAEVLLIYGSVLIEPGKLPEGIKVVSIELEPELNVPHYCRN